MKNRLKLIKYILEKLQEKNLYDNNLSFSYKKDKGYTAKYDKLVNEFITNLIYYRFPNDKILSEENSKKNNFKFSRKHYVWIIDPVCGTTNYIKEIPFYANSISISYNNIIVSGIFDPMRKELFFTDGKYSYLNKLKIQTSKTKKLNQAIISLNCNQSSSGIMLLEKLIKIFKPPVTRRVKIFESANLELAYVSSGRLDAYINPDDKIWDMIGGSQIIKNAGGKYTFLKGDFESLTNLKGIVASNGSLHKQILSIINEKL